MIQSIDDFKANISDSTMLYLDTPLSNNEQEAQRINRRRIFRILCDILQGLSTENIRLYQRFIVGNTSFPLPPAKKNQVEMDLRKWAPLTNGPHLLQHS